jgi:hypothetical protein
MILAGSRGAHGDCVCPGVCRSSSRHAQHGDNVFSIHQVKASNGLKPNSEQLDTGQFEIQPDQANQEAQGDLG